MWLSEPLNLSWTHDLSLSPETPLLKGDEIHLFCFPRIPFENPEMELHYLDALSLEEKDRAAGIKSQENQMVFIQSRARLRWLLGHQLGLPAQDVPLVIGPHGKPQHRFHEIAFNLSHSKGLILIGVAKGGEVGVDVEHPRPVRQLDGLIREVFSAGEQRWFVGLSEAEQNALFLRGWTLKEAFVKATGRGIAAGLSRVVIQENFLGFEAVPEGDPKGYQCYESAFLRARIAVVHRGETRTLRYYRGVFES
jgi:4'-phosphopantetheinyl transferase